MIAYRAETSMASLLREHMARGGDDARALLRQIFQSEADLTHLSAVLASLAALDVMSAPGFFAHLNAVAEHLYAGLGELFARSELPGHVQGLGARFGIYFGFAEKATDYRSATRFDHDLNNRFLEGCRQAGLHFHDFGAKNAPMHYGTTAAHETSDIDEALARLEPLFMKLGRLRAAALGESG